MGLCEQHLSNNIQEIFIGTRDPAVSGTELPVLWTLWGRDARTAEVQDLLGTDWGPLQGSREVLRR